MKTREEIEMEATQGVSLLPRANKIYSIDREYAAAQAPAQVYDLQARLEAAEKKLRRVREWADHGHIPGTQGMGAGLEAEMRNISASVRAALMTILDEKENDK